jgi:hypothetical protein
MNAQLLKYVFAIFHCTHAGAPPPLPEVVVQQRQTMGLFRKGFLAAMIGASALLINGTVNASLITNGDFTDGGNGWELLGSGCTGGAYYLSGGSAVGNTAPAVRLNGCGYEAYSPGMQQQVTDLTIGANYDLTWDYTYDHGGGAFGTSFGVYLDSVVIDLSDQHGGTWVTRTVSFMATSETHLVGFEAETDSRTPGTAGRSDRSFYVDNVVLVQAAPLVQAAASVSEPSILILFGLGFAGLGFARRKKI